MTHHASVPESAAWMVCRETARTHGRSFFLASRMLGPERRRAIHSAYAFCRIADDIVDRAQSDPRTTERVLCDWEQQIARPQHPVARAFAWTRAEFSIPADPVHELIDGMRADLRVTCYETWPDLRGYCYQAAGTVGLIVAPILGCSDPKALPQAAELGIAMQLTNILRDVGEDGRMGRIYLPLDEMERFGVRPEHLLAGQPSPGFPLLLQAQIVRARTLYARALQGVSALSTAGQMTTLMAAELYRGILDEIEVDHYQVLQRRAVVSRRSKGRLAAGAVGSFVRLQAERASPVPKAPSLPVSRSRTDVEGGLP